LENKDGGPYLLFYPKYASKIHNIILNSVRQHNYFITQGNYIGYKFRLWLVIFRPVFVICVTRCYAHFGIPSCLHPWNT